MRFIGRIIALSAVTVSLLTSVGCSAGKKEYSDITVTFMKVGKADAMIIQTPEHAVVIDAANSGEGKEIYELCAQNGHDTIDYFILTHFDQDHVGGAKAVISKFSDIGTILEANYEETSDEYLKYRQAAEKKGYIPEKVTDEISFILDEAKFTVYPALEDKYKQLNDYSLAVTVEYGEKAFIFTGDAENKRIGELLEQIPERKNGYDLVKMPHHGRIEKKTKELVEYLKPDYAVICCSRKEPADTEVTEILETNKVDTYYTYDGTVTFTCNGYKIVPSADEKTNE